jgi:hypothetical protein
LKKNCFIRKWNKKRIIIIKLNEKQKYKEQKRERDFELNIFKSELNENEYLSKKERKKTRWCWWCIRNKKCIYIYIYINAMVNIFIKNELFQLSYNS